MCLHGRARVCVCVCVCVCVPLRYCYPVLLFFFLLLFFSSSSLCWLYFNSSTETSHYNTDFGNIDRRSHNAELFINCLLIKSGPCL